MGGADIRGGHVAIDAGGMLSTIQDFVFDAPLGVLTVNRRLASAGGPGTFVKVLNGVLQGSGLIQGAGLQSGGVGLHTASSAFLRPGNSPGTRPVCRVNRRRRPARPVPAGPWPAHRPRRSRRRRSARPGR